MSTLPGGSSNAFGNEFQELWIARLLIDVVHGSALSVRIEPGDAVVRKAECLVQRSDGTTEAHQCKRQRGSIGNWSVVNLNAEGIISAAAAYLNESPTHRFWFVSGYPAAGLQTLCGRAADMDSIREFRAEAETNRETRRDFPELCKLLNVDPSVDDQLARLHDFLRRFRPVVEDISRQRREVEAYASRWIDGDPRDVVHEFEHLAKTSVRRQFDVNDLRTHLESKGFRLHDLTKDLNLPLKLAHHCDQYASSFAPYLIGGRTVGRAETEDVVKALDDTSVKVVLVHGSGGSGKSGVIFETLARLRAQRQPCFAIRLDQEEVGPTVREFARSLDLSASPVTCLATVSGGTQAVLLIDQLDAIRWTSQHSPKAMDVIADLIMSVLRESHVKAVIACRTFDANENDRMRNLFHELESDRKCLRRVEVPILSSDARNAILEGIRVSTGSLTGRQLETLRSLQNVWLLGKLTAEVGQTSFVSGADLNSKYWAWVRNQLTPEERTTLDERLIPALLNDVSGSAGKIPLDLQGKYQSLVARLLSIGALTRTGLRSIRFVHQTQYDFLAAEQLAGELRTGRETLTDWLLTHDELFHRNQLRQLLETLRDDDPTRFLNEVDAIVSHGDVRFHLKLVALQVLGSTDTPTDRELDLMLALDRDAATSPHVLPLFRSSVGWFDLLHRRGLILEWLRAIGDSRRGMAVWLMRTFAEQRGDVVVEISGSLDEGAKREVLDNVLSFSNITNLTDRLFAEYLALTRAGSPETRYVDIKKLTDEHPRRAIAVFRAQAIRIVESLGVESGQDTAEDRAGHTISDARDPMMLLAKRLPRTVWNSLWPVAAQCDSLRRQWGSPFRPGDRVDHSARRTRSRLGQFVEDLLIAAGRRLARRRSARIWRLCCRHVAPHRRMNNRVALSVLCALPYRYADRVLALLSASPRLLTCGRVASGSRHRAAATFPARELLKRFGAKASGATMCCVEQATRAIVTLREKEDWKYQHDSFMGVERLFFGSSKHQIYRRNIFVTQWALLSAFPSDMLSAEGQDWLGVLTRKFQPVDEILKEPPRSWGGFVGSTIPEQRALRMSDKAWLRLMASEKVSSSRHSRSRPSREMVESTPRMFAPQLGRAAHRDPERFAHLAIRAPATTRTEYVTALISALGNDKPPEKGSPNWKVAPTELTEVVLDRFDARCSERDIALAYCWLLVHRAAEPWSDRSLWKVAEFARSHPDPPPFAQKAESSKNAPSKDGFDSTAINSVRGVAATAIEALMFADPSRIAILRPGIDVVAEDDHPAVRVAATRIAFPLLNIDPNEAVQYCLRVNAHREEGVLGGSALAEFLSYTLSSHFASLKPIVERMVAALEDDVAEKGAEWVALCYLYDDRMRSDVEDMLGGRSAHRLGLAEVFGREMIDGRSNRDTREIFIRLCEDSE